MILPANPGRLGLRDPHFAQISFIWGQWHKGRLFAGARGAAVRADGRAGAEGAEGADGADGADGAEGADGGGGNMRHIPC